MNKYIIALSGGLASAYCAKLALEKYPKDKIILYFNDTKWEHPDLYRFLDDLSKHFDHPITYDNDGRTVEQVFIDNNAIANNRMPFCSRILKAERLQKYFNDGDTIIFGIGCNETHRAKRIIDVYNNITIKTGKKVYCLFPLISNNITKNQITNYFRSVNIEIPTLYKLGFSHNNCSGGCVRSGKSQWKLLYEKLPEVYKAREDTENLLREYTGKNISYLKDITLTKLREVIESNQRIEFEEEETPIECIGICNFQN